jgi:hypothetical protein
MGQFIKSVLGAVVLSAASIASAGVIDVNFDDPALVVGISPGNFYVPLGIHFGPPPFSGGTGGLVSTMTSHSGPNSLAITPPTVVTAPFGTVLTTDFSVYGFSFYYTSSDNLNPNTPGSIVINGDTVVLPASPSCPPATFPGLCNWVLFTYAGPLGAPLTVDFTGLANNYFVDDLALVPEPTSLALVALGLIGAGYASRRRQRA